MNAAALLKRSPHPTDKEIETNMHGNICRCGAYHRILIAIKLASSKI
jgi:isoquinoline 1-oxidoreductase alpha subunit